MLNVHHVGYLVKKMDKALSQFCALGFCRISDPVYDAIRDVDIVFMEKDGYVVELVSPKSKDSVVANLIKTYKNAPYHICYESDAFTEDLQMLESSGFTRIDEPTPAPAIENRKVCFLLGTGVGMIEILEKNLL